MVFFVLAIIIGCFVLGFARVYLGIFLSTVLAFVLGAVGASFIFNKNYALMGGVILAGAFFAAFRPSVEELLEGIEPKKFKMPKPSKKPLKPKKTRTP